MSPDEAAEYEAWLESFGDEKYLVRCKVCDAPTATRKSNYRSKDRRLLPESLI
jgi:hypothetical protein